MKKKIIIFIIIVLAAGLAYFYLTKYYFNEGVRYKVYTREDFPKALDFMSEEILEDSLEDLNKQYTKLADENDEYTYIRWINIGILNKRFNDFLGAEEAWQNAISYNPDQALAYGNLADLYLYDLNEYEKAEEYYLKVLSMRTDSYTYYFGLASLYRYNMTEKAHLIEIIMLDAAAQAPADAESYYLYLANYFYQDGADLAKSKEYYQKTLELNPDLVSQLPDYNAR